MESFREQRCRWCLGLFHICPCCDHGQVYCGPDCKKAGRDAQVREAKRKYLADEDVREGERERLPPSWRSSLPPAGPPAIAELEQRQRAGRFRKRMLETIRWTMLLIDTSGEKVGQINELLVVELGDHAFGHPTRITARARVGKGEAIDIEREVELGGNGDRRRMPTRGQLPRDLLR